MEFLEFLEFFIYYYYYYYYLINKYKDLAIFTNKKSSTYLNPKLGIFLRIFHQTWNFLPTTSN